jgi:hypothetical protein
MKNTSDFEWTSTITGREPEKTPLEVKGLPLKAANPL